MLGGAENRPNRTFQSLERPHISGLLPETGAFAQKVPKRAPRAVLRTIDFTRPQPTESRNRLENRESVKREGAERLSQALAVYCCKKGSHMNVVVIQPPGPTKRHRRTRTQIDLDEAQARLALLTREAAEIAEAIAKNATRGQKWIAGRIIRGALNVGSPKPFNVKRPK